MELQKTNILGVCVHMINMQEALATIGNLSPTPLELAEKLEQLRFLENGMTLQVHETKHETLGIDTPKDLSQALNLISTHTSNLP